MEIFNLKDHWNLFLKDEIRVNCKTIKLAIEFLTYCHEQGMKWNSGDSLLSISNWGNYQNQTYYNCPKSSNRLKYGSINYCTEENLCKIVKFIGFKEPQLKYQTGTRKIFFLNV